MKLAEASVHLNGMLGNYVEVMSFERSPAQSLPAKPGLRHRLLAPCALALTAVLSACDTGPAPGPTPPTGGGGGGGNGCVAARSQSVDAPQPAALAGAQSLTVSTPAPDWNAPHVPGQVLLLDYAPGLTAQSTAQVSALSGVQVQQIAPDLAVAYTPSGNSDQGFAQRLSQAGLSVQPNFIYEALATPNDPGYPGNAGVKVGTSAYDQDYLTRINAADGWNVVAACGKSNAGVLTAVLDTGVDANHPDLSSRLLPGKTFDKSGGMTNGAPEISAAEGDRGHGTGVAGLLGAATNNGIGLSGVTWQGRNILPLRVLGSQGGTSAALRSAINYATSQGAKVINMSLGYKVNPGDKLLDTALTNAAQRAVLVAAAGNTSSDGIYYPASHPAVLAVGAVGRADSLACYSARPGGSSGSRQLDLVAPGGNAGTGTGNCYVGNPYDQLTLTTTDSGSYTLRAGTSEAAPLVSGAASLVWGANPGLSAAQVKAILTNNARSVNGLKMLNVDASVRAALK